jgi:very-short-patch-repair endonuclease
MRQPGVVTGQPVEADKLAASKQLRRASTPEERLLWDRLRTGRLHGIHFRRQHVIDGFVVDFYCHAAGLVIEVDGPGHRRHSQQDAHRDAVLCGRGLTVLRITNEEVRTDIDAVLLRIEQAIAGSPSLQGRG